MPTAADLLSEVPLFQWMDGGERARLADDLQSTSFATGQFVFRYGDPGDSLYIIQSGQVEVFTEDNTGQRIVLGVLGPKAVFGELSLFDGGSRTASVVATSDVVALQLNRSHLEHFLGKSPAAAMELLTVMGRHMRANAEHLRRTTTRNANTVAEEQVSMVHRVAEWVAEFSGSIPFLVIQIGITAWWVLVNLGWFPGRVFDPYPFGLLSMAVSVEAVILSVFVLLSQNRQRRQDRVRSDIEYEINLNAEMEISHLHSKIDDWNSRFFRELREIKNKLPGGR
ncbi:MAG: rane protein [Bryobacterales bacterium]|nr:rane protein [Bryobacterales bacterium]